MRRASIVIFVAAACGGSSNNNNHPSDGNTPHDTAVDGAPLCPSPRIVPEAERAPLRDRFGVRASLTPAFEPAGSGSGSCDELAQTGCTAGQKCTWIEDQVTPTIIGHIGCAPDGNVLVGAACAYGAPGATGYDNCVQGAVCNSGTCKTICDLNGGTPQCSAADVCNPYSGLFDSGGTNVAGVCDPQCAPLDDNDIAGSGTRGSGCGSGQGCYGYPSSSTPTHFACSREVNPTLVNRSACTSASGCTDPSGNPFLNGCAQGYEPLLFDMTGSTQIICVAMCKPGNTFAGNACEHPAGIAPHECDSADARGTFNPATGSNNGDHCVYSWIFELDADGNLVRSPTSDTLGFCLDHSKYRYDSNGDGMVDGSDAVWPLCSTLPLTAGSGAGSNQPTAGEFGCVDSMTAGVTAAARAPRDLRLPYSRSRAR